MKILKKLKSSKLMKNTRGAVTVFVTLLLIPAILVSGTAVDIARIHTARSVLQDANQLAGNSVLTQYNALLYDIYGLFGVAKDDPILGQLLDEYISLSVFGEPSQNRKLGTLQLLYGSELGLNEVSFGDNMNLEDADVLRRQIEEYMKFRGPVIIVEEIIKALSNNSLKEDKEVIDEKTAIDEKIAELHEKYVALYNAIVAANSCKDINLGISGNPYNNISSYMKSIRSQFIDLKACYKDWEDAVNAGMSSSANASASDTDDENVVDDLAAKYEAILGNIRAYAIGGPNGSNWSNGRWRSITQGRSDLKTSAEGAKIKADEFKANFDKVVEISREIDAAHDELKQRIDELERKLNTGQCSEELKKGLTEKTGSPPMSLIERYRDILKWNNITAMSNKFRDGSYSYIDDKHKPMLDDLRYRDTTNPSAGSLTLDELANLSSNPAFRLTKSVSAANSKAAHFASFAERGVHYNMPNPFVKFAEYPGENKAFFDALEKMVKQPIGTPVKLYDEQEDAEGSDSKEKQKGLINQLLTLIDTVYTGLANNPMGAKYINDSNTPPPEKLGLLQIMRLIPETSNDGVFKILSDPLGTMAGAYNNILLLTYDTSMFSNYTTTRPDSLGKKLEDLSESDFPKTITGVPISPRVNYFFQSEWEYLYKGSFQAGENLSAVTRLLFLVRLICDYITVFTVKEITAIVAGIQASFAWCPPLAVGLGELARAAFAAAEALVDVVLLRTGHKVPLMKNVAKNEWVCSPSGIAHAISKIASDTAGKGIADQVNNGNSSGDSGNSGSGNSNAASGGASGEEDIERGLTYSQYLLCFLISKNLAGSKGAELAIRTGNLIEWNMINYMENINADERKMTEAAAKSDRFKLSDMATGFSLTTSIDVRMLFLSLPFAQRGVRGVIPPAVRPITVTDYRGY